MTMRLGLIGDNIHASRSPELHKLCGALCGVELTYEQLIPVERGEDFETVFRGARDEGLRGVNVTLPYKERVVSEVMVEDPVIARIGSVNTVVFEANGPRGHNTDYTGFMAAFDAALDSGPETACMIGAGGVGRAVAFGLLELGATEIRIVERDLAKAEALAAAMARTGRPTPVTVTDDLAAAIDGADGVLNCTPIGMVGYPGSPVPDGGFPRARWAFDAVYTPVDTAFRAQADAAGATFLSGFELFFHQGVDAFEIFTGTRPADLSELRRLLHAPEPARTA